MIKRLCILLCVVCSMCGAHAETYHFYIDDQTGWGDQFALYVWGDAELYGGWPGQVNPQATIISGVHYKIYSYNAQSGSEVNYHLIANNNGNSSTQLADFDVSEARDYYFRATTSGMVEVEAPLPSSMTAGTLKVDYTTPISANNRVIYELNLYDFTSAGTLAAAEARLDYLDKLGIDIIWLMPIYPRSVEGKIGSLGSPYAARDFRAVNPAHGSMADLQSFVQAAHQRGMSVWLDWVPNHTGLDHVWVSSHPEYYVWENGAIVHPNGYGDVYQLNYNSSALCSEMTNAMLYWVNEADIDGFRCDYVSSNAIPVSYWQTAIPALQNNNHNKRVEMLGEADFTEAAQRGRLFQAGFDFDFAWGYADGLKSVGTGTSAANARNAAQSLLSVLNNSYGSMSRMSYITNHDDIGNNFSSNYMTQCGTNVLPLTVMYFTFFGMPLIYNGQEIGYRNILNYFNRNTAISSVSPNIVTQNTFRALVALKHTLPALADGDATHRASTRLLTTNNSSVIAFEKSKNGNSVVVVLSLSDRAIDVTITGLASGDYYRVLDSETISSGFAAPTCYLASPATIHLPAKGYHIYTSGEIENILNPNQNATALETLSGASQPRAHKYIQDGQLLIKREGKNYTILGTRCH